MYTREIKGFSGEFRFLSNFYPCKFVIDGVIYPSSEHYYMCQKTDDPYKKSLILESTLPSRAKRIGRTLTLRPDWDEKHRNPAMLKGLIGKFSSEHMLNKLNSTMGAYLEETNHWGDTYWGVCHGEGKNMLGRMLMFIRDVHFKKLNDRYLTLVL